MKNIYIDNFDKLISILDFYQEQPDYCFRGQRDATWVLQPAISRQNALDNYIKKIIFPSNVNYPFSKDILDKWNHCKEVVDIVYQHTRQYLTYSKFNIKIKRLLWLCAYILKYNYYLGLYIEQNPNGHEFDSNTIHLKNIIPYHFWGTKDKFLGYFSFALQNLVTLTSLDNKILKLGMHDNIFTGYNQTFAQHYNFPTSVLDFTEKYLVALHFALENSDMNNSTCFSIYVYKQIDCSDKAPAIIIKEQIDSNIRAINQNGIFLYIRQPCTYYLNYGEFPTIDKLISNVENSELTPFAELTKYNIPYDNQNMINPLKRLLEKNNVNEQIIRPDKTRFPIFS